MQERLINNIAMRTLNIFIIGLLSATLLSSAQSCRTYSDQTSQEVPAKGKIKKSYYVAPFDAIELSGVANVTFSQSDKVKVEATGPENFLPFVVIESHDGVLRVNTRKLENKRSVKGIDIKISAPHLNRISNRGVGSFRTTSPLRTSALTVDNAGVGSVQLKNIECEHLKANNTGVGNMTLSGKVQTAEYKSSGVGDMNAKELKAQDVDLRHSGVGDITCHAGETIRIQSKGVGDVVYYGNPRVLSQTKKGVGSLISK